jgi:mediator of RNA polymerase II transcription subunit 22
VSVCRSDTVRKSSRGIEAICDRLLSRKGTEWGIRHVGKGVATMIQKNEIPGNIRRPQEGYGREWTGDRVKEYTSGEARDF